MKKCNDALDPVKYEKKDFLRFQRCVNLTYQEYTNKDYMNNNIYCEEFITQLSTIKSEIKNKLSNIPVVNDSRLITFLCKFHFFYTEERFWVFDIGQSKVTLF